MKKVILISLLAAVPALAQDVERSPFGTSSINFASPPALGSTTPAAVTGTDVAATNSLSFSKGQATNTTAVTVSNTTAGTASYSLFKATTSGGSTDNLQIGCASASVVTPVADAGFLYTDSGLANGLFIQPYAGPITFQTAAGTTRWTIAASTGYLTPATGLGIVGSTNGGTAANSLIGFYSQEEVLVADKISLSNGTAANVKSFPLTPGDWEIWGEVYFALSGTTATNFTVGFSTTSATIPGQGYINSMPLSTTTVTDTLVVPLPRVRFTYSAASTTIYVVAKSSFSAGTVGAYGTFRIRRVW